MSYELPGLIGFGETVTIENYQGIIYIPRCMRIVGALNLINCSDVGMFSDDVLILGHLNLEGSKVSRLPKKTWVGGNLNLINTEVETPPDSITVKGEFYK